MEGRGGTAETIETDIFQIQSELAKLNSGEHYFGVLALS